MISLFLSLSLGAYVSSACKKMLGVSSRSDKLLPTKQVFCFNEFTWGTWSWSPVGCLFASHHTARRVVVLRLPWVHGLSAIAAAAVNPRRSRHRRTCTWLTVARDTANRRVEFWSVFPRWSQINAHTMTLQDCRDETLHASLSSSFRQHVCMEWVHSKTCFISHSFFVFIIGMLENGIVWAALRRCWLHPLTFLIDWLTNKAHDETKINRDGTKICLI